MGELWYKGKQIGGGSSSSNEPVEPVALNPYIVGDNILINSDFRQPVNRNGQLAYTRYGMTVDMWINQDTEMSTFVEDGGLRIANDTDMPAAYFQSCTPVYLTGETVTLSVMINEEVYSSTGILSVSDSGDFDFPSITFGSGYLDIYQSYEDEKTAWVNFVLANGSSAFVRAVKLELGTEQTLAHQDEEGNWILNSPVDYDAEYLKCCLYDRKTGEWIGETVFNPTPNPNLLINPDWSNPVIQNYRPSSGWNNSVKNHYVIDMWKMYGALGTVNVLYKSTNQYLTVKCSASACGIFQDTYDSAGLSGGDFVTASIRVVGVSGKWRCMLYLIGNNVAKVFNNISVFGVDVIVEGPGIYQWTFRVPTDQSIKRFRLYLTKDSSSTGADDYINVNFIKLEKGSVSTLHLDPPVDRALEMLKCQQFFYACLLNTYSAVYPIAGVFNGAASKVEPGEDDTDTFIIKLPTNMLVDSNTFRVRCIAADYPEFYKQTEVDPCLYAYSMVDGAWFISHYIYLSDVTYYGFNRWGTDALGRTMTDVCTLSAKVKNNSSTNRSGTKAMALYLGTESQGAVYQLEFDARYF